MNFEPLAVEGAYLVRPDRHEDERGFFARLWCRDEFAARGIPLAMVQENVSHNRRAGTVRGMHFAAAPALEGKLVRCERGRILDVIVDLRPDSASFLRHAAIELDDRDRAALYVPPQVAHGFQTLVDDADVHYLMTEAYRPELARGVRHDDPAFGIRWPLPVSVIAARDRGYPDFDVETHRASRASGVPH